MQLLKLVIFALSVAVANALAEPDLDSWAQKTLTKLTEKCEKTKRKDWVERYRDLSAEVMTQIEEMTDQKFKSYSPKGALRELVSNVYPQHVPQGVKKSARNPCFADLWDYVNAKTAKNAADALEQFDDCSSMRFKTNRPEALSDIVACMKVLKE